MPFIPHTPIDVQEMLDTIGIEHIDMLFHEIPKNIMIEELRQIPAGMTEQELGQLMALRLNSIDQTSCYIGAGAYEHHIPAAVWDIASRGEFLTNYTPYQAEASQGTLQLLFEYQTMISSLMGLGVSNASVYDGATSLVEALLMAIRIKRKERIHSVWVPQTVHPHYREVIKTILTPHQIEVIEIPFEKEGIISVERLNQMVKSPQDCQVLVLPQPNFFGQCEHVDELTNWAHSRSAIVIGLVNPIAMAWFKPPGQWGHKGAQIACGEGQSLGIPLNAGGPYFGFLCTQEAYVRQLPGRIVARTKDSDNQEGFTLTLQAREQHIRREKANSNICTNQGLLVTAATIYMSLIGPLGLKQVAQVCYQKTQLLIKYLHEIVGIVPTFLGTHFHEIVISLDVDSNKVVEHMREQGVSAGLIITPYYPNLKNALLICVTETKSLADLLDYAKKLQLAIERVKYGDI